MLNFLQRQICSDDCACCNTEIEEKPEISKANRIRIELELQH